MKTFLYFGDHFRRRPAELLGFRIREDAPYPTIEPEENSTVSGALWEIASQDVLDRTMGHTDDPEHSLYWRLETADGTQVYVGNPERAKQSWSEAWGVSYDRASMVEALSNAKIREA